MSYNALGAFRILYALTFVFLLGIPQFEYLSKLPDFLYNPPPGLARLFSGFPGPGVIHVIDVLIVISILAVLVGWQTRVASYVFGGLVILCKTWAYSLGKIDHDFLVWLVPLCLGWHWGRGVSVDALVRKNEQHSTVSWPITFYALFLAFGFFSAAVPKILGGWLDPSFSMFREFVNVKLHRQATPDWMGELLSGIHTPFIWEIFDWLTIAFEAGFLLALLNVRAFRIFTAVAVTFHLCVYMTLGIAFTAYFSIYPLFWIPLLLPKEKNVRLKPFLIVLGLLAVYNIFCQVFGWEYSLRAVWPAGWDFNLCLLSFSAIAGITLVAFGEYLYLRRIPK